ncbi:elongation factor 1-beta [Paragonimus westermani]|uniref:Elongation factor 1-beta n=1 Tax=Paragonimus westermani TaxID=34504 RepID=A0A5J4NUU3_9TREM|nr:elongation factor 1-beta [Paragonimus westermani]
MDAFVPSNHFTVLRITVWVADLVVREVNSTDWSAAVKPAASDDVECDLFASDGEGDPDAEKVRAQRLAEYEAKKSKKPAETAKSNIILDGEPWGDDTDLRDMENLVRSIKADGLYWDQSKFVPLAYGIKKLQICCVVDDKGSAIMHEVNAL